MTEIQNGAVPESEPDAPEAIKNLRWASFIIARQWRQLISPPSLVLALVVASTAWWLATARNEDRLNLKDERIKLLGDQLSAYRERLQGATPDEAAKTIRELQARIDQQDRKIADLNAEVSPAPRSLSENQTRLLKEELQTHKDELKGLGVGAEMGSGEAFAYIKQFSDLLKSLGYQETNILAVTAATPVLPKSPRMAIAANDATKMPDGALLLEAILTKISIPIVRSNNPGLAPGHFALIAMKQ